MLVLHPILKPFVVRKYKLDHEAEEIYKITTKDGFILSLHRTKPKTKLAKKIPIILCHGIITNHYFMDLDNKHSLANFLAEKGFDVFNLSLRGTHSSKHPKGEMDHSIDQFIEDIDLVITEVCKITSSKQVDWVGHSMGAMILYCFLAVYPNAKTKKIRKFTSLAGPGNLHNIHPTLAKLGLKYIHILEKIDLCKLAILIIPYISFIPISFRKFSYTPQMTEKSTIKKMLYGLENIPKSLIQQFLQSVLLRGEIHSLDQKINYTRNFKNIKTPALFIGANFDVVVPSHSVEYVYDKISSKEKKFIYISKEEFSGDYGHACLVLGEKAREDIFPLIYKFHK
jgi:poly(3-hydroxyalkanoate) synthetase